MWHNFWVALPKYKNRSKWTQSIRFHFWRVLCGNAHEPKSDTLLCYCHSTSTNYRHATAANANEYMQILNVAFLRRQRHLLRIRVAPYTWTIPCAAESWFDVHWRFFTARWDNSSSFYIDRLCTWFQTCDLTRAQFLPTFFVRLFSLVETFCP